MSGVKSEFATDVLVSLPFRRQTTDIAKRTAFLGGNEGYVLNTKSVYDLVYGAYSKNIHHRDKWASQHNFLQECKQIPAWYDLAKFDKFLHLYTDINSVDSDEYLSIKDFCSYSITFSVNNNIGLVSSLLMFDKLRVMVHDSSFLGASTKICDRITSGDLMDTPSMYLHYAGHEAFCKYAADLRDGSCSRFSGHPAGEAVKFWIEVVDECFSSRNLDYVRVHYEHLMGKRSLLARGPAVSGAAPSPQKAAPTVPPTPKAASTATKKRKREAVDVSKLICTTQALFELDKGEGYKACTRANCTGHYGLGATTKVKALATVEDFSSKTSYIRLKRQVEKFYG
jgi:hypothetical protein